MNSHTPIFGEHNIYAIKSNINVNNIKTINKNFQKLIVKMLINYIYYNMVLMILYENYFNILEHPNHLGTFIMKNKYIVGISLWDMSKLAKLRINHINNNQEYKYHLAHNAFFIPNDQYFNNSSSSY